MRAPHLQCTLLLCSVLLFNVGCHTPKSAPANSTDMAYFGKDHLNGLMRTKDCVALRFYPALRAKGDVVTTALVIPVDKNGVELYSWAWGPWYQLYDRLVDGGPTGKRLLKSAATTTVMDVRELGQEPFAADFDNASVRALLDLDKANGLRVDHARSRDGEHTFEILPVHFTPDGVTVVGDGSHRQLCEQPCPSLCPGRYLHR